MTRTLAPMVLPASGPGVDQDQRARRTRALACAPMDVVVARNLSKTYQAGLVAVPAVREASFTIARGSLVAFVGPSGSGKSTLLNMVGCLDHPTSGTLSVLDTDVALLDRRAAADFRGANLGFIFQDFNLIPVLSAAENIEYPLLMVQEWPADKRRARMAKLLEAVGLRAVHRHRGAFRNRDMD